MTNPFETDLDRNPANYQPLTPLAHLARAAYVYPDHTAIIHGSQKTDYRTFYARSRQLRLEPCCTGDWQRRYGLGDAVQHTGDA